MAAAGHNSLTGKRILVVEDEYWLAREIAVALNDEGAEIVGPVSTLEAAQRLLSTDKPDCAVLDVNLHGEMAFPIAKHLQDCEVPFAIASGYDKQGLPPSLSNVPYLRKPFDPQVLRRLLPELLAGPAGAAQ